ncbi:TIGR02099 family protein [Kushneria pakistanensis]|uniref:TIGR02099 family protein n=1 Tax=Kushneria pakistanensis TaxID=1508770 RepID=A0ABQ3FQ42_9GAMM|nr:AsmA-like C-terminal region-containing protein [Kushneria pakistanensis]GHC32172.1 TIGR02099 family protein [Kushneria pakistanensis]
MSPLRILMRWLLTLMAIVLLLLAVVTTSLRLGVLNQPTLQQHVLEMLDLPSRYHVRWQDLRIDLEGRELVVALHNLALDGDEGTRSLVSLGAFEAHLDLADLLTGQALTLSSFQARDATIDLYETAPGQWGWGPETQDDDDEAFEITPERLTAWVQTLMRQSADLQNGRINFHARLPESISEDHVIDEGPFSTSSLLIDQFVIAGHGSASRTLAASARWEGNDEAGFSLAGRFDDISSLNGQLQLKADAEQTRRLASLWNGLWPDYGFSSASGQASLWAGWDKGDFTTGRLSLEVPALSGTHHDADFTLNDMTLEAGIAREPDGRWHGSVAQAGLARDGRALTLLPEAAELDAADDFSDFSVITTAFALDDVMAIADLMPLPDGESRQMLAGMALKGRIDGLSIRRRTGGPVETHAALREVSGQPVQQIPGFGPIDGWLSAEGLDAQLQFGARHTVLNLPKVFLAPWKLENVSGRLTFDVSDEGEIRFGGSDIRLERRGAHARGDFALTAPPGKPERFDMNVAFDGVSTDKPREWLPVNAIEDPEVRVWLDKRIHRADIPSGNVALRLVFNDDRPEAPDEDKVKLSVDARNVSLTWQEGWPPVTELDGQFRMSGNNFDADITHANLMGMVSRGAKAALRDQQFTLSALVTGDAGNLLELLQQAPLEDRSLSETLNSWRTSGSLIGSVNVSLPTTDPEAVRITGDGRLDNATLYSRESDLTVTDIKGDVHYGYRHQQSSITGGLDARVFEGPVKARLHLMDGGIDIAGRGYAEGVAGWLGLENIIPIVHGPIDYTAQIMLGDGGAQIHVQTPLEGLSLQLPQPFQKSPNSRLPLTLDVDVGSGAGELRAGDLVRARWRHNSHQGQVWLEEMPAEDVEWPLEDHWQVNWQADRLDLVAWQLAISQLSDTADDNSRRRRPDAPSQKISPIERVAINTDCVLFGVTCLGSAQGLAEVRGNDWHAMVDSSFLSGTADWRDNPELPVNVHVDWLDLTPLMTEARRSSEAANGSKKAGTTLTAYPEGLASLGDGEFAIDQVRLDGRTLGSVSGRWHSDDERIDISPLQIRMRDLVANGELVWERAGSLPSLSRLRLEAGAGDLGKTMASLGVDNVLRTDSGALDTQLAWPGAPWQFDIERVNGSINADLGSGRLTFVQSRWANLVSLLNLDNLVRRLQLNFSDVTRSGIAFKSVSARTTLHEGVVRTVEPVLFDGSATHFSVAGQVDIPQRTLDAHLGVTVPVSQNLPLAAVLVGAPQVGGVLYLLHKLFEPWFDRVSQVHYHVAGPWETPQVKLEHTR